MCFLFHLSSVGQKNPFRTRFFWQEDKRDLARGVLKIITLSSVIKILRRVLEEEYDWVISASSKVSSVHARQREHVLSCVGWTSRRRETRERSVYEVCVYPGTHIDVLSVLRVNCGFPCSRERRLLHRLLRRFSSGTCILRNLRVCPLSLSLSSRGDRSVLNQVISRHLENLRRQITDVQAT